MTQASLILCATRRLARSQQLRAARRDGVLAATDTIGGWLDRLFEEALLRGDLTGADSGLHVLSPLQERLVWRQIIGRALGKESAAALFDLDGLAAAAQEAHALMETWALSAAAVQALAHGTDETARFLQWRHGFLRHCERQGWRDQARQRRWQVGRIADGLGRLPGHIALAGFDRFNPVEQSLLDTLRERGVVLADWPLGGAAESTVEVAAFADADSEYRALAAWLRGRLAAAPAARLGVVVPDLAAARQMLMRRLDEAIAPAALSGSSEGGLPERPYNVSLGSALDGIPVVATALDLLRLATRARQVEQAALGGLLRSPYWSAALSEADGRALLDAEARRKLPATVTLERYIGFAQGRSARWGRTVPLSDALRHLEALRRQGVAARGRKRPGQWATAFRTLLQVVGWPGERPLASDDFQARESFLAVLDGLGGFDAVVGEQTVGEALALLGDACAEVLFQPKTEGVPRVEVLGLLEAAGESFDALWVSGMLAGAWPPPARPNPLLPALLQRAAGTPNASPEVQRAFASGIHRRFLQAAPAVVFSWPRFAGERALQPSPLLDGLPAAGRPYAVPLSSIEIARRATADVLETLADHQAPPVATADAAGHLKGGTALLKAQAICPAAAFYQFRLGAGALEAPVDGLDPRARGSLLHLVLEHFWRGRSLAEVGAWPADECAATISAAVVAGLHEYENGVAGAAVSSGHGPLPPRFRAIEAARLERLLAVWVTLELARGEDFTVVACEERHELLLDGIAASVVIDRIDELPDGRRLVLDYKTGARVDAGSWAAARIIEPQLPIYAVFAVNPHPLAGAAFAQVRTDKLGFVGVTETPGLLPKVKALTEARRRFPEADFADWAALLRHWRQSLLAIAGEIRAGDARVVFTDENHLALSPVRPLLRLAERRRQYEQGAGR